MIRIRTGTMPERRSIIQQRNTSSYFLRCAQQQQQTPMSTTITDTINNNNYFNYHQVRTGKNERGILHKFKAQIYRILQYFSLFK